VLNIDLTVVPSVPRMAITTSAMSKRISAYSIIAWPRSSVRAETARAACRPRADAGGPYAKPFV